PLLEFCRGLPPPILVPVGVLLLGYAESLKLLVVVWVSIWPILLNTTTATGLVDELLLDVSRTFHFGPITTVRKIVVPAVIPPFLLGVRIAIPLAIIITLLVEMLTSLPGIGSLIVTSQRQFRSAEVYGLLALVGVFGLLVNAVFAAIDPGMVCAPLDHDVARFHLHGRIIHVHVELAGQNDHVIDRFGPVHERR